ncbi:MAG: NAD/NADP octopine/nopaline dehydrogenase family protein [Pseudomonadota bacterium]|nr:NAD/NADP octopine/nopaline dehydrogenase family protein [Pseudomonadota bacterium]
MALFRSRLVRNNIGMYLAATGLTAQQIAQVSGIDAALVQQFADDPQLVPDLATAMPFLLRTPDADPGLLLSYAPPADEGTAEPLPVVVCGAGNLGHVFAGLLGARTDIDLRMLLSTKERADTFRANMEANGGVSVQMPDGTQVTGKPRIVTHDPAEAIPGARVVLMCVPSHVESALLDRVLPHLDRSDACIGSVPAPGGFDWKARAALQRHGKHATIFGLGYIPWMSKMLTFGSAARIPGGKSANVVAVDPPSKLAEVADLLAQVLQTPVLDLGSFLNMTLHAGNQVLHPGIMYAMFKDWDGTPLHEAPLFYEGATFEAAALCQDLSEEIQQLKQALERALPGLQLPLALPLQQSLQIGYGAAIADTSTLQTTIASNRAYAGIRTPVKPVDGGVVPDWDSRFFREDIPHGLVVLRGLADLVGLTLPRLDEILLWSQQKMSKEYLVDGKLQGKDVADSGAPQCFGITRIEALFTAQN